MNREEQIKHWLLLCNNKLSPEDVREREGSNGKILKYVSGTYVIGKLDEIFGLHWCSEVKSMHCGHGPVLTKFTPKPTRAKPNPEPYEKYVTGHEAIVRITIMLDGSVVTYKEGAGAGSGIDTYPDKALESSSKEAETDALKRAAYKFGPALGLAVYPDGADPYAMIGTPLYDKEGSLSMIGILHDRIKKAETMDEIRAINRDIKAELGVTITLDKDENDLRKAWHAQRNKMMKKEFAKTVAKKEEKEPVADEYENRKAS